jgi:hypothetical protein
MNGQIKVVIICTLQL